MKKLLPNLNSRLGRAAPLLIIGIVGIAASIALWNLTVKSENRTFALEYARRADNQASVLQNGISDYLDKLYSVRALFDASNHAITRDEFEAFSKSLLKNHPAILNISWIPRVKRGERAAHEAAAARDGVPDYHIRTVAPDQSLPVSSERDEYFPKFYSTEARTSPAYGLNIKDGGARERALAHIRDDDLLSASPPLLLHIGYGDRRGFWAGLPVYAPGLPHDTVDQRRRNLVGIVQGVFQIGVMIDAIFSGVKSPARLYLFAPHAGMNDPPIYSASHLSTGPIEAISQTVLSAEPHHAFPLAVGDLQWTMVVAPAQADLASINHERSWGLLLSGLLLTAGCASFVSAVRRSAYKLHLSNHELRQQKIILDTALENMSQGLCMFDAEGRIMLFNKHYEQMTGSSAGQLKGATLLDLIEQRRRKGECAGDPEVLFAEVTSDVREGRSSTRIIETSAKRALRVIEQPMREGGWVSTLEDITDWQEAQAQISYMAHHDALTGLANRTQLIEQLENSLAVLPLRGGNLAVHFMDIDRFKQINDTLGHDGGDFLLKTIAERLRSVTRDGDILARLGGDEFVVIQARVASKDQAEDFARRLTTAVAVPMDRGEQTIIATASVGIALAPGDGTSPERLLKCGDLALYKAKADGRNCVRFFQPEMDTELQARFKLEKMVRDAVQQDRFELHYQPLYEMSDRRLIGFEALIRLPADDGTLVPPLVFIPVAEDLRLIDKVGAWVLREACRTAATWPEHLTVAVNLSPAQFLSGSISDVVALALKEAGLAAHRLELEITETLLLGNSESIMGELKALKALGVAIVMDDFGTGYSSLSYLWRFPFDKIKIDRSFMQDFDSSGREAETVMKTIIALGRQLNMRVTVEGVETANQAAFLDEADGDQAQGFFFGRPIPASEISAGILKDFQSLISAQSCADDHRSTVTCRMIVDG